MVDGWSSISKATLWSPNKQQHLTGVSIVPPDMAYGLSNGTFCIDYFQNYVAFVTIGRSFICCNFNYKRYQFGLLSCSINIRYGKVRRTSHIDPGWIVVGFCYLQIHYENRQKLIGLRETRLKDW